MTTTEKIMEALRRKSLTAPELSSLIGNVTPRAVRYQLGLLVNRGFVRRHDQPRGLYSFKTDDGLFEECEACKKPFLCWALNNGLCKSCRLQGVKPTPAKYRMQRINTVAAQYERDDACSIAFHRLLRNPTIGGSF